MDSHPVSRYAEQVKHLPGDIIECGSYMLDSAIRMARACPDKTIFCCDTFAGMPEPGPLDGHKQGDFTPNWDEVRVIASTCPNIQLVRGMFQDTLPTFTDWRFALAYIDCDLYESAKYAVQMLWPSLTTGGYMVFDDFDNPACAGIPMLIRATFPDFIQDENKNFCAVRKT